MLQAPPGAGKTTGCRWRCLRRGLTPGRIVMLEPRRLAARAAAERMAETLGEPVGQTVGYRIRGEAKVSKATQDRGGHRRHPDPDDPVRPVAAGHRRGDLRRVPRTLAQCRSGAGTDVGGARRAARRSDPAGDVRDARRRPGRRAAGRCAGRSPPRAAPFRSKPAGSTARCARTRGSKPPRPI